MTPPYSHALPHTAPITIITERPLWRDTLVSLRIRNYRLFTFSNMVSMTGTWMQRIAQDWLVLELSGSVAAVGITVAMQFAPMLFFGLLGGVFIDRHSRRAILLATQLALFVFAALLAVLTLTGVVEVWHVYIIAFLVGSVTVFDNPARQVFVNELVGPTYLHNAISINSSVFQLGGLVGPAISGVLLVAVGAGWSFAINAVSCLFVVGALLLLRVQELHPTAQAVRAKGQLREGLKYVASKPAILWTVIMVAVLSLFTFSMPVLLASFANDVFRVGAGGYGLFNSLLAIGAFTGALASTRRRGIRLRTVIISAGVFGLLQATAGFMTGQLFFSLVLVGVGFANLLFITGANSLVQLSSNLAVRGRVMSVYVLVLLGGQAIGGPLMGFIVETWGAHVGMAISGMVPVVAASTIGVILARQGRLRLRVHLLHAPRFVSIEPAPDARPAGPATSTIPVEVTVGSGAR
ncbi:MFS transporter [Subtercola boreus]|uniref:MFS transporter n=1 Tax=Subtercola boreus TaxID=120213 RepID=A0A3E0WBY0_9MICO|nr:MFS transporter [Subtercola boreus]RFA22068.1 MFS transporter [Subtercola boreus]RFA22248.1 MFS transporter [Subtercola boreus]RFA28111.1 MFS transporter [Subtercola boreus]